MVEPEKNIIVFVSATREKSKGPAIWLALKEIRLEE